MIRSILNAQRGGVAILTAIGFLVFAIPLITGALSMAQVTSIDARVKTDITYKDYCNLAVIDLIEYLSKDTTRFDTGFAANDADSDGTAILDLGLAGVICEVAVTKAPPEVDGDPIGDPPVFIPFLGAYNQRDFQTFKTVEIPDPFFPGDSVLYTIEIHNRNRDDVVLNEIRDTLPDWFSYDCFGPANQLTLPASGALPQDIFPTIACPSGREIGWALPNGTIVKSGEEVRLNFTAVTSNVTGSAPSGIYCNEIQVVPGGNKTRSGQTAVVKIGDPGTDLCPGPAVQVRQSLKKVELKEPVFPYAIDIEYTIEVANIGTVDLVISDMVDLLPKGIAYVANTCEFSDTNCITDAPSQMHYIANSGGEEVDRWRVTWKFNPGVVVAPGETKTLDFSAEAISAQGNYWVDLLVGFEDYFPEKRYTWPTAVIAIKDVYTVAVIVNGAPGPTLLDLWVQVEGGEVQMWNIY